MMQINKQQKTIRLSNMNRIQTRFKIYNILNLLKKIMEYSGGTKTTQQLQNFFSQKNKILQPIKLKESVLIRKPIKPFSSSLIKQRKGIITKQDILKINSKLHLIKSKVMKNYPINKRSDSRKTLSSQWLSNEQLNDSVDLDDQDDNKCTKIGKAHLIKSPYNHRPPTIFFEYPKCCGIQQQTNDRVYSIQRPQLIYKIYGSQYKCIVNSLQYNGFKKYDGGSEWNILFDISGTHTKILETMNRYQKINHFPGCWNLGRKDNMWKHLNKMRRTFPQEYNFVPLTFLFPSDFQRFQAIRENAQKNQLWILKPSNAACGRGIKMINKQTKIKNKKDYQVSQYIANPHLINNFKYDLRIYILVTSYDPLKIYMFNEGLTRFATYQYNTKLKDIRKRFIHLTNFSVNKHSKKFVKNSKAEQDGQGSKWSLTALKRYYQQKGINCAQLFDQIKAVIIKTCISAEPVMLDIHSKTLQKRNCGFEIYGFDILIDSNLKPWLMEVNVCPSLSSSSPMDRKIKHMLLTDTLNIIGLEYYTKKQYKMDQKKEKERFLQKQDKKYFSKNINNLDNLNFNNCIQILSPEDWRILFEAEEQMSRIGNFERIFPTKNTIDQFKKLFQFNRYNNNILWKYIKSDRNWLEKLYQ